MASPPAGAVCERMGFGLWAAVERTSGEMVGQCGLTWQGLRQMAHGYPRLAIFWSGRPGTRATPLRRPGPAGTMPFQP